jgi:hypothetical protein
MPMRENCKHFQSRTYPNGEVARFCLLDLAPEAPWACPPTCEQFAPRLADVGWQHGSLIEPPVESEPEIKDKKVAFEVLANAESIVNEINVADLIKDDQDRSKGLFKFLKRFKNQ